MENFIPTSNALSSTVSTAKQRQPMCPDCEKSLPNQIVFDKIESIIRLMQDEQNGLPVKTAKSFMSKIPSVFMGTDLIQWMMRNLKLEDQQEALHLANLIASHGYIFPIDDHALSIKNDCTFYRFQTPCLWPSNNNDPENTDYAVYLCKRTMQGKTRLELADYEAENLARLQKMFSRKWEFIFMQAESQAKVDKKRDKLERKVLDSQERAFWDVYRPVPGCVNTTELDIKKACRLSKSAKRCSECQKVAAALTCQTSAGAALSNAQMTVPNADQDLKESAQVIFAPTSTTGKSVQIVEDVTKRDDAKSRLIGQDRRTSSSVMDEKVCDASKQQQENSSNSNSNQKSSPETSGSNEVTAESKTNVSENQSLAMAKKAMEEGKGPTSCLKHSQPPPSANDSSISKETESTTATATAITTATSTTTTTTIPRSCSSVASRGIGGHQHHHHPHQHPHHSHHHSHHHHHHHHHPHSHQHGHHHHHHCAHHKHHQVTAFQQQQQQQQAHDSKLSMPSESILTATVACATALGQTDDAKQETLASVDSSEQLESASENENELKPKLAEREGEKREAIEREQEQEQEQEQKALKQNLAPSSGVSRAHTWSMKRSVASIDCYPSQSARLPQMQASSLSGDSTGCRRRSECNRTLSTTEPTLERARVSTSPPTTRDLSTPPGASADACTDRPASACSSFQSLGNNSKQIKAVATDQQTASSALGRGQRLAGNQQQQQSIFRKGSLSIIARPASTGSELIDERPEGNAAGTSTGGYTGFVTHRKGSAHPPIRGAKSLVCGQSTGEFSGVGEAGDEQHIGDLERELEALKVRLDRKIGGVKMSKVTQSYLSYFKQWADYDPFIAQPIPSNPWISDSTELWDSERQTKEVHCRRVRRWAFSLKELLNDPAGREQFHRFLEKEFSAENLKFWDAVQELKRVHARDVARRVEAIWIEYLAQDANCPINIDSKSYETSKKNMAKNKNNRYIFDEAAGHVYQLMKNDSYPRYLRSEMYKDYKEVSEKRRNQVAFDVFKPQITTLKHKFNF